MIGEKKSLKKITMATGVVAMAVGLISAFSFEANASTTTGGGGCYTSSTLHCHEWTVEGVHYGGGDQQLCSFTGVYGPPYQCTEFSCAEKRIQRKCVASTL